MVELLRAPADRIEAGRAQPADIAAALHEARLFRLLLPRASTAWCLGQGAGCTMAAATVGSGDHLDHLGEGLEGQLVAAKAVGSAPLLGQHSGDVLADWLRMDSDAIGELKTAKVIAQ